MLVELEGSSGGVLREGVSMVFGCGLGGFGRGGAL